MILRKKYLSIIASFCLLFILAACGNNEEKNATKPEVKKDITLTDAMGKVTIPADAKNILATNMEDSLVALGVTPVAQWAIGTAVHDYLQTELKDVPTIEWNMPIEQVINAEPDLILFSDPTAVPTGQYEDYKAVAPTYVFKTEDSADWRKQLQVMGEILGKEDKAKEVLADYESKVKDASEKVKESIGNESAAIIWIIGGQYYLLEDNRYSAKVLYDDLGVSQPKMIQDLPSASDAAWSPVTLEALADLDADHVFLVSAPGEAGLTTLNDSSIWKGLPASKNGQVYEIEDDGRWTINGKIASELSLDQIVESLTK